jgi:Xaa-Pro aminopeptidase
MSYFNINETNKRLDKVRQVLESKNLDAALIYYDELNIANGWYLTGWCPQFESGAVLVPIKGEPLLLGGPESEPFADMSSAIKTTRNFPVFMVPDEEYPNATIIDFKMLNDELRAGGTVIKRLGFVGTATIPHLVYTQLEEGFAGTEFVDITDEYEVLRAIKSEWEIENIKKAFEMTDLAYDAMKTKIKPGAYEYEVAAAGEVICRSMGASSFAYTTIVGSGLRAKAVVPTAINKKMEAGETVMIGIAPRYMGYAGTFGDNLPVSGQFSQEQKDCMNYLRETLRLTKAMLKPGVSGREIDIPGRKYYTEKGLIDYLVCPFAHTIGLMEAEAPFFGPNSDDILVPGMAVMVDVSFFGHPKFSGARIETGYVITESGCEPFSKKMDDYFMQDI